MATARKMTPVVPPLPPGGTHAAYPCPKASSKGREIVLQMMILDIQLLFQRNNSFPKKRIDHVSQFIADFRANKQCGKIAALHHVLVPVNWNSLLIRLILQGGGG